jgi:hypothetical protein
MTIYSGVCGGAATLDIGKEYLIKFIYDTALY